MKYLRTKWHELMGNFELKKILVNINWLLLDTFVRMGVSFFVGVWVVRHLGPEQFGFLSYAGAMVAFFSVFSKLGLDAITVRELVVGTIAREKIMGTVFFLKLWGGVSAVALSAAIVYLTNPDPLMALLTAITAFSLVFQATDVIDYWFQSQVVSKYVAYAKSGASIASGVFKIGLIMMDASLVWFAAAFALEALLVAVGFLWAYMRMHTHVAIWRFDTAVAKTLMKDAWPLILSAISVMIYMRIDQVMIGNMIGYEALGNYTAAVRISEMWYFIPTIVTGSVFPAIIQTKKRDEKLYYARLQKLYDMMIWLAIAIAVPMTFLSEWIVSVLYGVDYAKAASVLVIHVWIGIFAFIGAASGKWFIAEKYQNLAFRRTFYGMIINVALNFLLIPRYGMQGAAWATLIGQSFSAYFSDIISLKTRKMFFMKTKSFFPVHYFIKYLK